MFLNSGDELDMLEVPIDPVSRSDNTLVPSESTGRVANTTTGHLRNPDLLQKHPFTLAGKGQRVGPNLV